MHTCSYDGRTIILESWKPVWAGHGWVRADDAFQTAGSGRGQSDVSRVYGRSGGGGTAEVEVVMTMMCVRFGVAGATELGSGSRGEL